MTKLKFNFKIHFMAICLLATGFEVMAKDNVNTLTVTPEPDSSYKISSDLDNEIQNQKLLTKSGSKSKYLSLIHI